MRNTPRKAWILTDIIVPLLILIIVAFLVLQAVASIGSTAQAGQLANMEDSLRRNAVQCYVLEGSYPENLEYLAANYNVVLNQEEYVYHYTYWGSNIMPDIFVFPR